MVDNLYAAERLGREKLDEYLREAERDRLQRRLAEASRPAPRRLGTWLAAGSASTPAPKRA